MNEFAQQPARKRAMSMKLSTAVTLMIGSVIGSVLILVYALWFMQISGATRDGVKDTALAVARTLADAPEVKRGLTLPPLRADVEQALVPVLPSFVHPANPLDITGNVLNDTPMIGRAMQCLAADKDTHGIVLFIGMMHSIADAFVAALSEARKQVHCPIIVIWVGALESSIQALEAVGIPVFLDIPQATSAMSHCLQIATTRQAIASRPAAAPLAGIKDDGQNGATLSEWGGKQLLASQSAIAMPKGVLIREGQAVPDDLSYPIVAKLQSAQLLHKSDAGGVILRIQDKAALEAAAKRLFALGKELQLPVQGVLAEQMLPFDHELLLGLRRDARFGPVLTIARGGVEAELDPDVVNLLLPATAEDILAALGRLRSAKLLRGFRGKPGVDMDALASRIHQICEWFSSQPLREVEINPLAIRGNEVWALDALITPMAGAN